MRAPYVFLRYMCRRAGPCVVCGSVLAAMQLEWPRCDSRVVPECTVYTVLLLMVPTMVVVISTTMVEKVDEEGRRKGGNEGQRGTEKDS